jgi:hypothetical protein
MEGNWQTYYSMHLGEGCSHVQACEIADNDCEADKFVEEDRDESGNECLNCGAYNSKDHHCGNH